LIAADVETARTKVFDSYNYNNNADDPLITIDHVLASAAIPKNFPYVEINGRK
jgi:NTE family protein